MAGTSDLANSKPLAYQIENGMRRKARRASGCEPGISGNARQKSSCTGARPMRPLNQWLSRLSMSPRLPLRLAYERSGLTLSETMSARFHTKPIPNGMHRGHRPRAGILKLAKESVRENLIPFPPRQSPLFEAWFRAEQSCTSSRGNEHRAGKVVDAVASPPHIRMDCYFSGGNVASGRTLPMAQWIQVVHTYRNGIRGFMSMEP